MTFPLKDTRLFMGDLFIASIDIMLLISSSAAPEISLGIVNVSDDKSSSVYSLM